MWMWTSTTCRTAAGKSEKPFGRLWQRAAFPSCWVRTQGKGPVSMCWNMGYLALGHWGHRLPPLQPSLTTGRWEQGRTDPFPMEKTHSPSAFRCFQHFLLVVFSLINLVFCIWMRKRPWSTIEQKYPLLSPVPCQRILSTAVADVAWYWDFVAHQTARGSATSQYSFVMNGQSSPNSMLALYCFHYIGWLVCVCSYLISDPNL